MNRVVKCRYCSKVYFEIRENKECPFCKRKQEDASFDFLKDFFGMNDKN